MYKKVLVPLDGSELAECSLNHVKNLAKDGSIGEVIAFFIFLPTSKR
jgi:nucleotide-binding universal stress UspA family protein